MKNLKYLQYSGVILLMITSLVYAPPAHAGFFGDVFGGLTDFTNTLSNALSSLASLTYKLANLTVSLVSAGYELTAGSLQCGLTGGNSCNLLDSAKCRLSILNGNTPPQIGGATSLCAPGSNILTILPSINAAACVGSGQLTFYNNFGPHSAAEQNSNFQLYRFTDSQSARYWPWTNVPYNDTYAQNAEIMMWLDAIDQKVGDGLIAPYDFSAKNSNSYFMAGNGVATVSPIAEVPYSQVCNAQGVCNAEDLSVPKDVFAAYIAKTTAKYDLTIPYDDKEIYPVQNGGCPSGSSVSQWNSQQCVAQGWTSWGGWGTNYVDPIYYIPYNGGRIPVNKDIQAPSIDTRYYVTDASGNRIFLNLIANPVNYGSVATDFQLTLNEKDKPFNFDVEYPIEEVCPVGYARSQGGRCSKDSGYNGQLIYADLLYYVDYNGGKVPASAQYSGIANQYSSQQSTPTNILITDTSGNKIFAQAGTAISGGTTCPAGYSVQYGNGCTNYNLNPNTVPSQYYSSSVIKLNDSKMVSDINVSHVITFSCPQYYTLNNYSKTCSNSWDYISLPAVASLAYGGGTLTLTTEVAAGSQSSGKYSINDISGNKYTGDAANGIIVPEGSPASPKFSVTYPMAVTSSQPFPGFNPTFYPQVSSLTLTGYNGGTYVPTLYSFPFSHHANFRTIYFVGGKKYEYVLNQPTQSVVMDRYTSAGSVIFPVIQSKFLSAKSGVAPTDTYEELPQGGLVVGNDILGPFKSVTSADCVASQAPKSPSIIQQSCNSITLQSADLKPLTVARRVLGSNSAFAAIKAMDFSANSTFIDTGLQPHTQYEYVLQDLSIPGAPQIPTSASVSAYTTCLPSCKLANTSLNVAKYSTVDLKWQCVADTVPVSCQVQSTDSKIGTRTGLSPTATLTISPDANSQYTLSCANVDGAVTQPPVNVNIFVPGVKEIKPQ